MEIVNRKVSETTTKDLVRTVNTALYGIINDNTQSAGNRVAAAEILLQYLRYLDSL